jgi:hypothetical protein
MSVASRAQMALSGASWPEFWKYVDAEAHKKDAIKAYEPFHPPHDVNAAPFMHAAAYIDVNARAQTAWSKSNSELKGIILSAVGSELDTVLRSPDNYGRPAAEWLQLVYNHLSAVAFAGRRAVVREYESLRFNGQIDAFLETADRLRNKMVAVGLGEQVADVAWVEKLSCCVGAHPLLASWAERLDERWQIGGGPQSVAAWALELRSVWAEQCYKAKSFNKPGNPRTGDGNAVNIAATDPGNARGPCNYCGKTGHLWRRCTSLASDRRAGRVHTFKAGPNAGQPVPSPGSKPPAGGQPAGAPRPGGGVVPRPGESVIAAAVPQLAALGSTLPRGAIILDTGSGAAHVLGSPQFFTALRACEKAVRYGSAAPTVLAWEGPAVIRTNGGILNLPNVLFDPELPYGIVSARLLETTQGIQMGKDPDLASCFFVKAGSDEILFTATLHEPSGCYLLSEASDAMVGTSLSA